MNIDDLKLKVCKAIDEHREEIIRIGEEIFNNPEMGFKEFKTAQRVADTFKRLGMDYQHSMAVTGLKSIVKGRSSNINVAVIGELDAVICPAHPQADPSTGASHACGHNAQIAAMLGVAFGLVHSGVMEELDGDVSFMAVPAEEFVELEYREHLKATGKVHLLSGKQELIRLGAFDDVDMAMMVHSHGATEERKVFLNGGSSGFVAKTVRFIGKEAHAGGAPHEGTNALNAAMMAIMGIHVQREVFRDEDGIRVHPIITRGGDLVNVVPADVRMETFVRGKTIDAILAANDKVNRAIKSGADCVGAEVQINEIPGYLPLKQDVQLGDIFAANMAQFLPEKNIIRGVDTAGSTDIGDLSAIMPIIQPTMGGYRGSLHSREFGIVDQEAAYILPAKAMAMSVVDLLFNGAAAGRNIKAQFVPRYSTSEYLKEWGKLL